MERGELDGRVVQALNMLYARDASLLETDTAEWSIAPLCSAMAKYTQYPSI